MTVLAVLTFFFWPALQDTGHCQRGNCDGLGRFRRLCPFRPDSLNQHDYIHILALGNQDCNSNSIFNP